MMSAYNKLVRDRVPEKICLEKRIQHKINRASIHTQALAKIGTEEIREFASMKEREHALDSLADALEVIISLARAEGASIEDVNAFVRKKK